MYISEGIVLLGLFFVINYTYYMYTCTCTCTSVVGDIGLFGLTTTSPLSSSSFISFNSSRFLGRDGFISGRRSKADIVLRLKWNNRCTVIVYD